LFSRKIYIKNDLEKKLNRVDEDEHEEKERKQNPIRVKEMKKTPPETD
jgi:hypothetical protein